MLKSFYVNPLAFKKWIKCWNSRTSKENNEISQKGSKHEV